MDDDSRGECQCGSIDFERVVVERKSRDAYTTDFVACTCCKTMLYVPLGPVVGGPFKRNQIRDTDERLKRGVEGGQRLREAGAAHSSAKVTSHDGRLRVTCVPLHG
jgi:hypothetical protein